MSRYFVTGTDTDVGKTRVAAALALALQRAGRAPTYVTIVQTGVAAREPGDAQRVGMLAGCAARELRRYEKAADPWSAALAAGVVPPSAQALWGELERIGGNIVAEGAGGVAVPLNARETFADVARMASLRAVVVVGLRLGCINHAILTAGFLKEAGIQTEGAVLSARWQAVDGGYCADVTRALQGTMSVLGIIPFEVNEERCVQSATVMFEGLV